MPASDPWLRRVSVQAGTAAVDLALPAGVPVAILIPSIVDTLQGRGLDGAGVLEPRRYQLSPLGATALDSSTTLAQNGIREGSVLILTQSSTPPPPPSYDDVAEAVSETLDAAAPRESRMRRRQASRLAGALTAGCLTSIGAVMLIRNAFRTNETASSVGVAASASFVALLFAMIAHRVYRDAMAGLTLSVIATAFAAVAGFMAVPGVPGVPNVLLAATVAAVTSVLTMRLSGCGVVPLTALSCVAIIVAVAALVGVLTAAPPCAIGSVSALISLGLLGVAARMSIVLAGLSPQLTPPAAPEPAARLNDRTIRADNWLASLLAAFSSSAAVGAMVTVLAGAPRLCCVAFGTVTGALLLLRARSVGQRHRLVLIVAGITSTATAFGVVATHMSEHGPWVAAMTASLVAAALYLGFIAPVISLSPVIRRGVEVLECLALVAMVPLACWVCGLYGAVRGFAVK